MITSSDAIFIERLMRYHPQGSFVHAVTRGGLGEVAFLDGASAILKVGDIVLVDGLVSDRAKAALFGLLHEGRFVTSSGPAWDSVVLNEAPVPAMRVARAKYDRAGIWADPLVRLPDPIKLARLTPEDFCLLDEMPWSEGALEAYRGRDFGPFGFCVKRDNKILAICASYCETPEGVEIGVDTDPCHRRLGYATAACIPFLRECVSRGKKPSWDAANLASRALAQRLGFTIVQEYSSVIIL